MNKKLQSDILVYLSNNFRLITLSKLHETEELRHYSRKQIQDTLDTLIKVS